MDANIPNQVETPPIKTCCLLTRPAADFLMWYRELAKIDGVKLEPGANASMVETDKQGFIFVDEGCLENLAPFVDEFGFFALTSLEFKDSAYILKQRVTAPKRGKKAEPPKTYERELPRWTGEPLEENYWSVEWSRF